MVPRLVLACSRRPRRPCSETRLDDGYALTLSGGVSLGSYEAGLNWTLVRLFRTRMGEMLVRRRPRLVGVTGASAGSINALLVAALYCETDESAARSSVDDNLLTERLAAGGAGHAPPRGPARLPARRRGAGLGRARAGGGPGPPGALRRAGWRSARAAGSRSASP